MEFRVLGPLEVHHEGRSIQLGGIKQRATLGYLLLNANRVVPTSELIDALWPCVDELPVSARKILQNAVWKLRQILSSAAELDAPMLKTETPGYVLEVEPEIVDLFVFRRESTEGRAALAEGDPERAARTLRSALSIWRGRAMSDLVESGITWPEFTTAENARLEAWEDWFEAELACGRHGVVLNELEAFVAAEPLRERGCAQLMVALYRCGRHADALAAYASLRDSLVEDLGLEPSPSLQRLQSSILVHDESLLPVSPGGATNGSQRSPEHAESVTVPELTVPSRRTPPDRRHVSVVSVRAQVQHHPTSDPTDLDNRLKTTTDLVDALLTEAGGSVAASFGSVSLALFERSAGEDANDRAVQAALLLREYFDSDLSLVRSASVSVAVASGEALVLCPSESDQTPAVHGALVDRCLALLPSVPAGEVWICDQTHRLITTRFAVEPLDSFPAARLLSASINSETSADCYTSELTILHSLWERMQRNCTTQLVTVIAEHDKTVEDFLTAFGNSIAVGHPSVGLTVIPQGGADESAFIEWYSSLQRTAQTTPLVAVLRDLHLADDCVIDVIDEWTDGAPARMLLIVTATQQLLARRPRWGGGMKHVATITLQPSFDLEVNRLHLAALTAMQRDAA